MLLARTQLRKGNCVSVLELLNRSSAPVKLMTSLVIFSQDATQTNTDLQDAFKQDLSRKWWRNPKLKLSILHEKCSVLTLEYFQNINIRSLLSRTAEHIFTQMDAVLKRSVTNIELNNARRCFPLSSHRYCFVQGGAADHSRNHNVASVPSSMTTKKTLLH